MFILLPLHHGRCIMIPYKDKSCIFAKTIRFCGGNTRKRATPTNMLVPSLHRFVLSVSLSPAIYCHVIGEEINDNNVTL